MTNSHAADILETVNEGFKCNHLIESLFGENKERDEAFNLAVQLLQNTQFLVFHLVNTCNEIWIDRSRISAFMGAKHLKTGESTLLYVDYSDDPVQVLEKPEYVANVLRAEMPEYDDEN